MKPAPLYHIYSQERPLIPATVNNSHPNSLPAMMMTLNAINNSSLTLYDGSVVDGTVFFTLSSSTKNNRSNAVTTHCHTMHSRTISFGDASSHSTLINHRNVSDSGFLQGPQAVSQRSVRSQVLQTDVVLSPIDESTTRHNMRKETVNRTAFFF